MTTAPGPDVARRFYVETLGCPKNVVDSDRIVASLVADGLVATGDPSEADLVVVNTCAFIEPAREESIETILGLAAARKEGARLVATGCLAERSGAELADALPELDAVVGFAGETTIASAAGFAPVTFRTRPTGVRDLLELPRAVPDAPWAYVKIAEGCDRACAFCAIPSFRGKQRSRRPDAIEAEVADLVARGVSEVVLVAQDLAWYGRDVDEPGALAPLLRRLDRLATDGLARVRLLYLYPSEVRDPLVETMLELPTVVPYFDLSLQHASAGLLRGMKRWGSGDRFLEIIERIRTDEPAAAFRSSFIVGFPGETERDHDELLAFLDAAALDWAGFFAFSREEGTAAASLTGAPADDVVRERLRELAEVQEPITAGARAALVDTRVDVLIDGFEDGEAIGRTYREAPEIDGVVRLDAEWARPGAIVEAVVTGSEGPDLEARPLAVVEVA
ncbi:MAG TPA: 30S ribosomal protein S12 methylthiotransferase RimO [Acidimicrobiia bacterium]|nr:30S ribosomal protein S12 methylthiotransferase RimO [Acidimicrobiia bacterium]